ncbi:hypothetical protein CVT24_002741 [Panaeolus cyanescens]|uniref:F-box domain-containing protein n=1 Tax=Panaeolus cyanescens TaxID=181874 RepID=A0A409WJC0_9AGAR|nr:hypothetical protein CVT24_002741 [Panaeolus cyanescens]
MQLPHEVIDLVLGLLANDPSGPEIEAIKAFSLTSSTIHAICGPHLYSSIYFCLHSALFPDQEDYLQPDIYYPRCEISVAQFRQIQTKKPWINHRVKRLGIVIFDERQWLKHRQWWSDLEEILIELQHDNIEWFKLYTNSYGQSQTSPSALSGPISKILKSPVLSTLHLYCVRNFPFYHLFAAPSKLQHLDIGNTYVDSDLGQSESSVPFKSQIKLDSLTLRWGCHQNIITIGTWDSMQQMSFIDPLVDVSSLSSFAMRLTHGDRERDIALTCLILDSAKNIERFTLHSSTHEFELCKPTSLASSIERQSATLHTLALTWRFIHIFPVLSHVPELLEIGPKLFNVRHIQLQILFPTTLPPNIRQGPVWNEDEWVRLSSSLSRFPALRSLDLCMGVTEPRHPKSRAMQKLAEEWLEKAQNMISEQLDPNVVSMQFTRSVKFRL